MTTEIRPPAAHQRPSGKLYLGTNQLNLVNATDTLVLLDTIAPGFTDGIENTATHRITPGVAGFYLLTVQVGFFNPVAARAYRAYIWIGGGPIATYNSSWAGGGTYFSLLLSAEVKLLATNYVELYARSDSGDNTVDIAGALHQTYFSVQRVR